MRRSGKKRKLVETLLDVEEFGELESEIKTEPTEIQFLDDASHLVSCCCLCKTYSDNNLAIFGSGPKHDPEIAKMMRSCSGLEISSDANAEVHICRGCLQQLDGHYAFQKKALQCNEYAKNQKVEGGVEFDIRPEVIRVCRFCLKIRRNLLEMYPDGESPECNLLQKIRECLDIEVNSRDPVTKICRNCIKNVDDLLEFRTRHLPTSEYLKDEIWHYGPSKLVKRIKQDNEDTSKQDLDVALSVSDLDCSSEENERNDSTFARRQKLAAMRPEMIQLIGAEVDGKNFTVLREDNEPMKVIFEDQLFRFHSERINSSSLWNCDNRKFRNCRMQLEIDATGRCATLSAGVVRHTHPPGTPKLLQCPSGKGMVEINGKAEPFYMYYSKKSIHQSNIDIRRTLIHQGFRYFLNYINTRGVDSVWYCIEQQYGGCKARFMCYGIFHKAAISGEHNHTKLSQCDIKALLLQHRINTTSTNAISEFQNVNTIEMITEPRMTFPKRISEKNPQIFRLLKQDDAERNFEVTEIGATLKIVQDMYEYRYYDELSDKCTIWKCIMATMRRCTLLVIMTPDGKHLEIYKGKHNHGSEAEEIFRYPLGKRLIGEEPLWLLNRISLYNDNRFIVYRDYLFYIDHINQKEVVRWRCCKKYCCRAALYTKGNFQEVILKNEHSHEKLPKSMVAELIIGSTTSIAHEEVDADILSFKQKLLSYSSTKTQIWDEGDNEYEALYILRETKEVTRRRLIFRRNEFSFETVDQKRTSKWLCRRANCNVMAFVVGLFETIVVAEQHKHEMMSDAMMEHLIKQCTSLPNSTGEN